MLASVNSFETEPCHTEQCHQEAQEVFSMEVSAARQRPDGSSDMAAEAGEEPGAASALP